MTEPTGDKLDDEAEEKPARWIFNLVVLFLVFAFAIDLSYMTSSILPVGIGLSLIAWRVWRTPEITNPISSRLGECLRPLVKDLAIGFAVGPILLGVVAYPSSDPNAVSRGFPFSVTYEIPWCFGPGGPVHCLGYDPLAIILDYLFWAGLSFIVLASAGWARTRIA